MTPTPTTYHDLRTLRLERRLERLRRVTAFLTVTTAIFACATVVLAATH